MLAPSIKTPKRPCLPKETEPRQMRRLPTTESGFPRHAPETGERGNRIFFRHGWKKNTSDIHIMAEKKGNKKIVTFLCHVFPVSIIEYGKFIEEKNAKRQKIFFTRP
jgi:hypothetical protein